MNRRLQIRPEALTNLEKIKSWYEKESPGQGERFIENIRVAIYRILALPYASPIVYRDVHRQVLRTFPFHIFFRVDSQSVRVLSVVHHRRDPKKWPK